MPETRTERIARLEATTDRTPRQDAMLAHDRKLGDAIARLDALDRAWREQD